jgi:hypothetical protein
MGHDSHSNTEAEAGILTLNRIQPDLTMSKRQHCNKQNTVPFRPSVHQFGNFLLAEMADKFSFELWRNLMTQKIRP